MLMIFYFFLLMYYIATFCGCCLQNYLCIRDNFDELASYVDIAYYFK